MKTIVAVVLASGIALFSASASADLIQVEVDARQNAYTDGIALDTLIDLAVGDRLSMQATGCWSAGAADRTSDADGLDGGSPCNTVSGSYNYGFHTADGFTARYGALVGRIGAGNYFVVGNSYSDIVSTAGRLYLGYWDSYTGDNSGSVLVDIHTTVPEPGTLGLLGIGLAGLGFAGRRKKA